MPTRRSHRSPYADRAQPPLHLGSRRGREHRARGDERDHRKRDQQVDDDPRRLVEQNAHPGARGKADVAQAEAARACLDEDFIQVPRVAQPDLGQVRVRVVIGVEPLLDLLPGNVEAGLGEREADVVGGLHEADHPLRPKPPQVVNVAQVGTPGLCEPTFQQHLPPPRPEVAPGHDRIAPPAPRVDHFRHRVMPLMAATRDPGVGRFEAQ